jgi:hypothetical protein
MVDLNGHKTGNGGYGQRKPKAHRVSSTPLLGRFSHSGKRRSMVGDVQFPSFLPKWNGFAAARSGQGRATFGRGEAPPLRARTDAKPSRQEGKSSLPILLTHYRARIPQIAYHRQKPLLLPPIDLIHFHLPQRQLSSPLRPSKPRKESDEERFSASLQKGLSNIALCLRPEERNG